MSRRRCSSSRTRTPSHEPDRVHRRSSPRCRLVAAPAFAQERQSPRRRRRPPRTQAAPKSDPNVDLAFGAFQRGYYLTAFNEATKRVDEKQDPKAMTLIAELYANGFGIKQDDAKAAEWYRLAADRGDREAMFALAMFRIGGRGGAKSKEDAAKLLASAAKLGHVAAAYDLALLYIEGAAIPAGFRARRRIAPPGRRMPAVRKRNTRSEPSTRKAAACRKTNARPRSSWARPRSPAISMRMTEYSIALYNGTGVAKDEAAAAAILSESRPPRQPDRPEPAGARVCERPGPAGRPGRGHQMAPDFQGRRRRHRPVPRRIRAKAAAQGARRRRESRQAVACDHRGVEILSLP